MLVASVPFTFAGATTGDLSASFASDPLSIAGAFAVTVQVVVSTSAAPVGTFSVQGSVDGSNWADIAGATASPTVDGSWLLDIGAPAFAWMRLAYARISGTGTVRAILATKGSA